MSIYEKTNVARALLYWAVKEAKQWLIDHDCKPEF